MFGCFSHINEMQEKIFRVKKMMGQFWNELALQIGLATFST